MARLVRGQLTPQLQQGSTEEPESNPIIPWQEEQPVATKGKVVADCKPDSDYEKEGSDHELQAVEKEGENSNTEYVKMELPEGRILHQRMMNQAVA